MIEKCYEAVNRSDFMLGDDGRWSLGSERFSNVEFNVHVECANGWRHRVRQWPPLFFRRNLDHCGGGGMHVRHAVGTNSIAPPAGAARAVDDFHFAPERDRFATRRCIIWSVCGSSSSSNDLA